MVIRSLLDTDLYKFTMAQAVLHQFPGVKARYAFRCRNRKHEVLLPIIHDLRDEIAALAELRLTREEANYLGKLRFLKPDFVEFMRLFRFNPDYVGFGESHDGEFWLEIGGPWLHTIFFEVPVLAIVNELFFRREVKDKEAAFKEGQRRLDQKLAFLKHCPEAFKFAEFGTRRRFSADWHRRILPSLMKSGHMTGTSNVMFAMETGAKPIGTMAHEWLQAGQALTRVRDSQCHMLDSWVREYRGDLGIALTDVIGIDAFLKDFDLYFAKLYDGVRHDSGSPFDFATKVIHHYNKLGIDPLTKTAVFTDSLDLQTAMKIHAEFSPFIKISFGIGTNLTNDLGPEPLNIVIKMVSCDGQPVAKISDAPGKNMCEEEDYVEYLKSTFERKE